MLPKIYVVLVHKNDLGANLYDMKRFWNLNELEFDEKFKTRIMASANRNLYLIKFFNYSTPMVVVVFINEASRNFHVCFPEFVPNIINSDFVKITIKFFLFVLVFYNCVFCTTFDTLTVCTIVYLKIQFSILGYKLQEIINKSESSNREEIINCIKYHCFLIR